MAAIVDAGKCSGSGQCIEACPTEAIKLENDIAVVDEENCADCAVCVDECPTEAISMPD